MKIINFFKSKRLETQGNSDVKNLFIKDHKSHKFLLGTLDELKS